MAEELSQSINSVPIHSQSSSLRNLVSINATTQLPIKLTPFKLSFLECTIQGVNHVQLRPQWKEGVFSRRLDQLLLRAIVASTWEIAMFFIASATALMEARDKLIIHLYANRSRSRVMTLKDRLSNFSQGTIDQSLRTYLSTDKDNIGWA